MLFTWLILDLLQAGGMAAVIVPEGVLFNSTGAHKELRRQLLFYHDLQGVISLPGGVFQPYTGVKTSILVFKKGGGIEEGVPSVGQPPRTKKVWFYDVTSDGYSLGAKREPDYTRNDLWDALAKWERREESPESTVYYQPEIFKARWRTIDERALGIFPELRHGWEQGREWGIHELFSNELFADSQYALEPTADPDVITRHISKVQRPRIFGIFQLRLAATEAQIATKISNGRRQKRDPFDQDLRDLDQLFNRKMDEMLEDNRKYRNNPTYARDALKPLIAEALATAREQMEEYAARVAKSSNIGIFAQESPTKEETTGIDWEREVKDIVREFARVDGNDIMLRSADVAPVVSDAPQESKSWSAPVRVLRENPDWRDGLGSHDDRGEVRPEYLVDPEIYEDQAYNIIKKDYLDPNCIEANDFNLSASRYKPFKPSAVQYEPPAKLIRELQELEGQIMTRLDNLLEMVEGSK